MSLLDHLCLHGRRYRIQHQYSYDRDIMCLPKCHTDRSGLVKIPQKKNVCDFLARNHLMGKICLSSERSEKSITREVRSVFDKDFPFKILQNSGGSSRTVSTPAVSSSFKWTASAVSGRNAKVPIYIYTG